MRQWMWIVVGLIGAGWGVFAGRTENPSVHANQAVPQISAATGLITHVQELEGRHTRVVVIDPQRSVMGVYDIGREDGEIQLRSIRNLNADLQMLEFNSASPSPADIQKSIQRQ